MEKVVNIRVITWDVGKIPVYFNITYNCTVLIFEINELVVYL